MTSDPLRVLRPGIITRDHIEAVLDKKVEMDPGLLSNSGSEILDTPRSPGMKYQHYAPKADMLVIEGEAGKVRSEMIRLKSLNESIGLNVGLISFNERDYLTAAHDFYANVRALDEEGVDMIIAGALSENDGIGFAVMNRMMKAAGYNVVKV
jgi:L-threonylcarbamoyladenylate synthase